MENFDITIIRSGKKETGLHTVTEEAPLTIEINGNELATLLCSPEYLENLVYGFLFTSGLLNDLSSIKGMTIDRENWKASVRMEADLLPMKMVFKRIYTSGCGKGIIFHNPFDLMQMDAIGDGFSIESSRIEKLMKEFQTISQEYRITHGVHSSALSTKDEIIIFRDDIGRHNAIDKVVGEAISGGIDFSDKLILTSGRISSEIISKLIRCSFQVVVAAGAPTNQAVKLARSVNLTLIGLARGKSMNLYSGEKRVL